MPHAAHVRILISRFRVITWSLCGLAIGCDGPALGPTHPAPATSALQESLDAVDAGSSDMIRVDDQPVSDADAQRLSAAVALRVVQLDHPRNELTDEGLKRLAQLPHLEHLRVRGGKLSDAGLRAIAGLKTLRILNLPQGDFTDAGLEALAELPDLEQLRIGSPRITDAGLPALARCPSLKRLHLIGVPITDAGLDVLQRLAGLESLYLDDALVSDAGLERLFTARPDLHVHVNQAHHDRDPHRH